jgi:hypothetical protein
MALDRNRLTKVSQLNPMTDHAAAPDPALWYYVTADSVATILTAGYFSSEAGKLEIDDRIWVETIDGHHMLKVTAMTVRPTPSITVAAIVGNMAKGQATTVTAVDTIVTGLASVSGVIVSLNDDPTDNPEWVSASTGNQAGAPAAGSFYLKTWQNTSGTDPTPVAATTFGKKVNWLAWQ